MSDRTTKRLPRFAISFKRASTRRLRKSAAVLVIMGRKIVFANAYRKFGLSIFESGSFHFLIIHYGFDSQIHQGSRHALFFDCSTDFGA